VQSAPTLQPIWLHQQGYHLDESKHDMQSMRHAACFERIAWCGAAATACVAAAGPVTWPAADERRFTQVQLEHCFVLPQQQQQPTMRVKVVQSFKRAWGPAGGWRLIGIDLHREK
jgi:hypothetical protein